MNEVYAAAVTVLGSIVVALINRTPAQAAAPVSASAGANPQPQAPTWLQRWRWPLTALIIVAVTGTVLWLARNQQSATVEQVTPGNTIAQSTVAFYDFEQEEELQDWNVSDVYAGRVSIERGDVSLIGQHSLRVTTPVSSTLTDNNPHDFVVTLDQQFTGEIIIARVYWPETPNAQVQYASFCLMPIDREQYACVRSLQTKPGTWQTLTINVSQEKDDQGSSLKGRTFKGIALLGRVTGQVDPAPREATFYLDALEVWPIPTP